MLSTYFLGGRAITVLIEKEMSSEKVFRLNKTHGLNFRKADFIALRQYFGR